MRARGSKMRALRGLVVAVLVPAMGCSYDWSVFRCEGAGTVAPDCRAIQLPNTPQPVTMDLCRIPAGCFAMGSPLDEPCREPGTNTIKETRHEVLLTHPFEITATEVTQAQYWVVDPAKQFAHNNTDPDCHLTCKNCEVCFCETSSCDNNPADTVSWHDAASFCNALSLKTGYEECYACSWVGDPGALECTARFDKIYDCPGFRLPTEAEWEYAYRAGTSTAFYDSQQGPSNPTDCAGTSFDIKGIAWYGTDLAHRTHAVRQLAPNGWGLYDMAGNVFEWCQDWFVADLGGEPQIDPYHGATGSQRVVRNGNWDHYDTPRYLRAAYRSHRKPAEPFHHLGFRCARSLEVE